MNGLMRRSKSRLQSPRSRTTTRCLARRENQCSSHYRGEVHRTVRRACDVYATAAIAPCGSAARASSRRFIAFGTWRCDLARG